MSVVFEVDAPATGIVEKLTRLYTVLRDGMRSYERIAFKITDCQLQQSVLNIAQECKQYAAEVFAQIYCIGGNLNLPQEDRILEEPGVKEKTISENISEVSEVYEKKMLPFYRAIQKEAMQIEELKTMVAYQMKGFLFHIEQLKLLRI